MVSIEGLDIAKVFLALYRAAAPKLLGSLLHDMSLEEARGIMTRSRNLSHYGDVDLGLDLSDDRAFDPEFFDSVHGEGAAQKAIDGLRQCKPISMDGMTKAFVFMALYNAAWPKCKGAPQGDIGIGDADKMLHPNNAGTNLWSPMGVSLFVDLADGSGFDPSRYDSLYGEGAAQKAIDDQNKRG